MAHATVTVCSKMNKGPAAHDMTERAATLRDPGAKHDILRACCGNNEALRTSTEPHIAVAIVLHVQGARQLRQTSFLWIRGFSHCSADSARHQRGFPLKLSPCVWTLHPLHQGISRQGRPSGRSWICHLIHEEPHYNFPLLPYIADLPLSHHRMSAHCH